MNLEEALKLTNAAVFVRSNRYLKDIAVIMMRGAWQGLGYHKVAEDWKSAAEYYIARLTAADNADRDLS